MNRGTTAVAVCSYPRQRNRSQHEPPPVQVRGTNNDSEQLLHIWEWRSAIDNNCVSWTWAIMVRYQKGIHPRLVTNNGIRLLSWITKCEQKCLSFKQSMLKLLGLLADPIATRRGPPGALGPQFENRWTRGVDPLPKLGVFKCVRLPDTQCQKRHHNVTSQNDVTRTEQNRLGM